MKEQTLQEMMLAIRRNAKPSKCIDNFENLLKEIDDTRITGIVIREMSGFMSKMFEIFHEADKMDNLELKSRIIHKDFICPERYFKRSKSIANRLMKFKAAIEYHENPKHILSRTTKDADRKDIVIKYREACDLSTEAAVWYGGMDLDVSEIKELARRTMLLYHYIPAITKALIQTKRRKLGVDSNSKRF